MSKQLLTIAFAALLGAWPSVAAAQNLTLRGKVASGADSTALASATVYTGEGGRINANCDASGKFVLGGVPRKTDTLYIVLMGYLSAKLPFTSPKSGSTVDLGTIFLEENTSSIDAVVVRGDPPIAIQKGDTTQFNADAFATNPDADADQLVTKMPGIIIENGKIEAQGEPVRRVYVDGKLMFGTDPMAALKNLPADAVESVQLFDEQSEMARISGIEDGETNKAINIVTRSKKTSSTIFRSEASGGTDIDDPRSARYLVGGNFSRFTPKHRLTLTAQTNNINTSKFGQSEPMTSDVDENGNLRNQSVGLQKISSAGINYAFENKKVEFSGSYFFDNNRNNIVSRRERNYYPDPRGQFMSRYVEYNDNTSRDNSNHRAEFKFEYRPNPQNTFVLSPRLSVRNREESGMREALTTQSKTEAVPMDSLNRSLSRMPSEDHNIVFAGEAAWSHKFASKPRRSLSLGLSYSITNSAQESYRIDDYRDKYSTGNSRWESANLVNRYQDQENSSNYVRAKISWSEPFATYHRLLANYIMSRDWGTSAKSSNSFDSATQAYSKRDVSQCSNFDRDYNSIGGGLGYAFYKKPLSIHTGVDFLRIDQKREEFEPNQVSTHLQFNDIRPSFSLRYSIEKSRYLRIYYQGRTVLPRIDQMQNVINTTSTTNWRVGNPDLKQGYQNTLTLFYNASNVKKSTNFTYTLSAQTNQNYITTITETLPMDTVVYATLKGDTIGKGHRTPTEGIFLHKQTNLDGYISARTSATYSFPLKPIRSNINLSATYNFTRTPSIYGGIHNFASIHSGSVRVGVTSNISRNVDFNFYSNTAFNYTANTQRFNVSYLNQNLYYSLNLILPGGIVFNTLVTWKYYMSTGNADVSSSYWLLDAGLGKKFLKSRNAEFRITAYDLLAQNLNLQHFVQTNYVEDLQTNSLGRYVMARLSYRFNSMSGKNQGTAKGSGKHGDYNRLQEQQMRNSAAPGHGRRN